VQYLLYPLYGGLVDTIRLVWYIFSPRELMLLVGGRVYMNDMRVLDSGNLRVHWLLRRRPRVLRFYKISNVEKHVVRVRSTLRSREIGVYVHIPYCRATCMFCPYFRQVIRSREELDAYLEAVLKEVELYGRILRDLNLKVVEIHVGGGTPSLTPPRFYRNLYDKLSEFFTIRTGIGIEANPEDLLNPSLVEEYYASGVDEISIGVQSFDERALKSIGRRHKPSDNEKAVAYCLRAGFKWINVDVMFLTPNIKGYVELKFEDKLSIFTRDLEVAHELGVHQITYYPTVIPKGSPGYKLVELGRVSQEVDLIDRFVEAAIDFGERRKLHFVRAYSLSRRPYEYATVNLEMVGPLLGFGASAWSNTGYYQYINIHSVDGYVKMVKESRFPAVYSRVLEENTATWRVFFDQLSTGRVMYRVFSDLASNQV
jgi:coproporphyrinogen III oxidase-like Fe-S oxidoreductase